MISRATSVCMAGAVWLLSAGVAGAESSADAFLQKITDAVNATNYEGTLIRSVDGRIDTLHVLHSNQDGVIREKLVAMDGEGREIIRNGDQLICLMPKRRIKLVDRNSMPSNTFVRLPAAEGQLDRFYELVEQGPDRVAGRAVLRYLVRPRDVYRYGHQLWVDTETSLPLRMQLLSARRVIEEIRFVNIAVGESIPAEAFVSDIDSTGFKVIHASEPVDRRQASVLTQAPDQLAGTIERARDWPAEPSPGFRFRATQSQTVRINGRVTQRLVFSDGLATVSVFIDTQPADGDVKSAEKIQMARLGAANSYQRRVGNHTMTLVGEVPVETLRLLAERTEKQMRAGQAFRDQSTQ